VSARDKATGKENKITIKANSGLTEDEIQKMVKDAEVNAAEDHARRELVEARNHGEALVHTTRKSLAEHGEKLSADEKAAVESAIKEADEALKTEDKDKIDAATAALMTASQKIGEKLYAEQQAGAAAGGASAAAGAGPEQGGGRQGAKEDDVVDAEFKEVKRDA
jgi:molecular chaperone DnaK